MNNKCKNFNYSRIFPIFADKIQLIIYLKTCNNMKSIIRKFVGAALLLALPLSFTSCDDILGKWDKPLPPAAITLKNALDNGAKVEFSYKIGDTQYTAAFVKVGDKYNIVGGGDPESEKLEYDAATNRLKYTYLEGFGGDDGYAPILEVYFDIATTSFFVISFPGLENLSFDGNITILDTTISLPNAYPKKAIIADGGAKLIINYAEGETWEKVAERLKSCNHNYWVYAEDGKMRTSFVDSNIAPNWKHLCYVISLTASPVASTDVVGKKGDDNYTDDYQAVLAGPVG